MTNDELCRGTRARNRAAATSASRALRATILLVCAGCAVAHADVLVGPSGERLPGHLVEDRDGVLIFQSDFLGRITVQSDRAHVERDPAPAVADKDSAATPDKGVTQASPDAPGVPRWSSDLEATIGQDRGSLKTPENTVNAGWKLSRKSLDGEMNATINYKYKNT